MNVVQIAIWYLLVYGLVVAIGGGIGYLKARSKISLVSGIVSGVLLLVAWYLAGRNPMLGLSLGLALAVVLLVVFAKRLMSTRKLMPAGPMLFLAMGALVLCLVGLQSS